MQLRHVQYLVTTVDEGSVSAAARVLHVTQPALSRQLRQLEHDLGVSLFDRAAGRLALNRTGRALLPAARELLAAAAALRSAAAFHRHGGVQRLTVAAPTVTLTDVVSPFVTTLTPDDPVVDVRPVDGEEPAQVLRGGADLAITARRPPAPHHSRLLAVLPVWAYVPPGHAWSARARVRLAELLEEPLVLPPPVYAARDALDTAVRASGASYGGVVETANGTIAQALAAAGRGVAVVSDDPRFDLRPVAVELERELLTIRLVASWDGGSAAAPAVESLVARLADWVDAHFRAQA